MNLVKTEKGNARITADKGVYWEVQYFNGVRSIVRKDRALHLIPDTGATRKLSDLEVVARMKLNELKSNSDAQLIQRNVWNEVLKMIR